MENHKLVLPENLNQYGYLFGGDLLKWVDEFAWMAASLEHPGCSFVTLAMDKVEFRQSVRKGTILRFVADLSKTGNTSVQYAVTAFSGNTSNADEPIFSTHVTLVNVDQHGCKKKLSSNPSAPPA